MSQTITITNNFHNTTARLRVPDSGSITKRQYQRAMRKLCGISDCTCGGERGSRYQLVKDSGSYEPSYYVVDAEEYAQY